MLRQLVVLKILNICNIAFLCKYYYTDRCFEVSDTSFEVIDRIDCIFV